MPIKPAQPLRQATLVDVRNINDVYLQLSQQLAFPPHFGHNLDALFDLLSRELPGPLRIFWPNALAAKAHFPQHDFDDLLGVFNDAVEERDDLEVVIS